MNKKTIMKSILLVCLLALTGINLYTYFSGNVYKEFDLIQVGGKENWAKLQTAFSTEKYQQSKKDELKKAKEMMNATAPVAQDPHGDAMTKKGTPVLDELAKIKQAHPFVKGDENARFTILEYSEILCPYCQRHSKDGTLEAVMEAFSGDVNIMHIPYLVHGQANELEQGILCARDQKDAKMYYDLIKKAFATPATNKQLLLTLAKEIGYDEKALDTCISEEKYAKALVDQTAEARALFGVTGTPGNIIIDTKTGKYIFVS